MTPDSELDRLFGKALSEIPKPDPLDAEETAEGICAQGESK